MRRAQDGDRHAYEVFLAEAAALLRRFVRLRLRQPDYVEDIVQDALLSIHHYRHTYDPERPVRPWMYAIARHRLLDFVAKQRRRREQEVQMELETETDTEQESSGAAVPGMGPAHLVLWALALLPRAQREIIELLKLQGYSVAEISSKTGRSESSIKVSAHRGYKTLRKLIEGTGREK